MVHYDCDYCGVNDKSNEDHSIDCPNNHINRGKTLLKKKKNSYSKTCLEKK